jgi:branched-chain amino acid transport system substrate-binding protein
VAKFNPDAYVTIVGAELIIPQAALLEKMGYTNDIIFPDFTPEGDVRKIMERLNGSGEWMVWGGRYASVYDDLPEIQKIEEATKKFGHNYPLSSRHAHGWTIARILEQALVRAGWPCSRSELIASLEKTDLDTKGITGGPIRFSPTDHYGPTWWRAYRWNHDKNKLEPAMDWFEIENEKIEKK